MKAPKNQLEQEMSRSGLPEHYPAGACCYFHHVNPVAQSELGRVSQPNHPNQPNSRVSTSIKPRPQSAAEGRNYAKMVKKLAPKHMPIGQAGAFMKGAMAEIKFAPRKVLELPDDASSPRSPRRRPASARAASDRERQH